MKTFFQNICIFIFIYMPFIIVISSLVLFFIKDKQIYLKYTSFILNAIFLIVISLLTATIFYPLGEDRFGFAVEIFFLLLSSLIFMIVYSINFYFNKKNNTYEDTHIYFLKKNYKYVLKRLLRTLIAMFLVFQFFLIWSAFNAYEKARQHGYIGKGYSVLSFYSPFVKAIEFNKKRYSYHRAKYVDYDE